MTALLIVSMGSYAGSLINFGLFVPLFGLFLFTVARQRQVAVRLVGGSVLAAAVVLGTIYREFLGVFLSDMAPRFLTSEARAGTWSLGATGLTLAQRYYTFYGFLYLPLISLGAWSFWKRRPPAFVASFISAWAAVFCLLIFFRTGMPDLFMKVKEILWVTPLVCLLRRRSSRRGGATSAAMAMGGSALLRWGCPVRRLLLRRRHRGKIPTCAIEPGGFSLTFVMSDCTVSRLPRSRCRERN